MTKIDWSKYQAIRRVSAFPSIPNEKRFTIQQLREAASRAEVLFRGRPFIAVRHFDSHGGAVPHNVDDGIEIIINEPEIDTPYIEQWNLLMSGAFLHRIVMRELFDPRAKGERVLNPIETMYHVAEAIGSLWRLYEALAVPDEEEVTIEFAYEDTEERELKVLDPARVPFDRRSLCYATLVEVSRTQPLYLWRASDAQSAAEICLEIFQQFQWEPSLRQIEDEIRPFLGRLAPSSVR